MTVILLEFKNLDQLTARDPEEDPSTAVFVEFIYLLSHYREDRQALSKHVFKSFQAVV